MRNYINGMNRNTLSGIDRSTMMYAQGGVLPDTENPNMQSVVNDPNLTRPINPQSMQEAPMIPAQVEQAPKELAMENPSIGEMIALTNKSNNLVSKIPKEYQGKTTMFASPTLGFNEALMAAKANPQFKAFAYKGEVYKLDKLGYQRVDKNELVKKQAKKVATTKLAKDRIDHIDSAVLAKQLKKVAGTKKNITKDTIDSALKRIGFKSK